MPHQPFTFPVATAEDTDALDASDSAPLWFRRPRAEVVLAAEVASAGAEDADRRGLLGAEVVAAVTDAGLPGHFVPREHGGGDGLFSQLLADIAQLAEGCSAAGWCAGLWAAHGRYAACLPEAGQEELWSAGPGTRIAAGLAPPVGVVVPADGGWRLSGRWQCVSGIPYSDWVLLAATEGDATGGAGAGRPARMLAVPVADVEVHATWDATGLRGTASHTVETSQLFVPRRRSFLLGEMLSGAGARSGGPMHRAPAQLVGGPLFCATALGAARRMLTHWSRWAALDAGPSSAAGGASAAVQKSLSLASARIDAAGMFLAAAGRRADESRFGEAAVATNRKDAAFGATLLTEAADTMFTTGGSHVLNASGAVQRLWRDVHTATAHGVLRMEPAAAAYASATLGARETGGAGRA